MTAETHSNQYSASALDALADELNRDGICTLRGLLPRDLVEEWRLAFNQLFERRQKQEGGLAPREESRYYLTLPWVPPFANEQVFANPAILGVLDRVLAQEYVMVQLGADIPVRGARDQEIHRDYRPLFSDDVVTPLYALAVNFPLVEVTHENGPFQMARGTHVLPRDDGLAKIESGEIELESFLMQPGDVSIRTPLALHRGSANTTPEPRPMIVMGYVMHWLHTPKVDLTLPRDFYNNLAEEKRALLRCDVVDELKERAETYTEFKY